MAGLEHSAGWQAATLIATVLEIALVRVPLVN
jgi:hypothetical protein